MKHTTVNTQLTEEYINEDEYIYAVGDSILSQLYYGNYSDSIEQMVELHIEPSELAEYLEEQAEEYDMRVDEMYNNHFTASLWASIGMDYAKAYVTKQGRVA